MNGIITEEERARIDAIYDQLNARKVEVVESISEDNWYRGMAHALINHMADAGAFGNSLTRYLVAERLLGEAIEAQRAFNYFQVGDGMFSLKDIAETKWAKNMGIVAKPEPLRSVLTLTAGTTMRLLIANGAIVRIGHRYKLGDLRSVLGRL